MFNTSSLKNIFPACVIKIHNFRKRDYKYGYYFTLLLVLLAMNQ